jgi:tetratricopeptide (TPR) repeat protein
MRIAIALPFLLMAVTPAVAQSAPEYELCRDSLRDASARLLACSLIIKDNSLPAEFRGNAYLNRAEAYSDMDNHEAAITDCGEALKFVPVDAELYNLLAWSYYKMGKTSEALPNAEKAVSLDPQSANAYDTRGHIYEALNRKAEAITDFRSALAINPALAESRTGLQRLGAAP